MNIFVGNLSFKAREEDIKSLFGGFGSVDSVRIVMEKKGDKSRGFGFVQIPNEQEALAAIEALNGREFMGRPLNVSPARPKPEVERDRAEAKKINSGIMSEGRERDRENRAKEDTWYYGPAFNKKRGRYKAGRRSQSFMKRRAASVTAREVTPERKSRENPMRWRKKYEQPKPRQKKEVEDKPRKKAEGKPEPWKRADSGGSRPWKKSVSGKPNPWRRNRRRSRPRQSQVESRRKPGGYTR
ncbi:MAG: RNA-binding protein [Candidatus Omnitrophota bacterium]